MFIFMMKRSTKRFLLTLKKFIISLLTEKINCFNPILHCKKLTRQFIISAWLMIEGKNLEFIKKINQNLLKTNMLQMRSLTMI